MIGDCSKDIGEDSTFWRFLRKQWLQAGFSKPPAILRPYYSPRSFCLSPFAMISSPAHCLCSALNLWSILFGSVFLPKCHRCCSLWLRYQFGILSQRVPLMGIIISSWLHNEDMFFLKKSPNHDANKPQSDVVFILGGWNTTVLFSSSLEGR